MPELVVDYAWQHPDPAAVKAAGYGGVVRYLSYDPSKNLTPAELLSLHAVGLAVALVWEAGAQDELGGSVTGSKESGDANKLADALGWPADRPIYYAADFAAVGGQLDTVHAYLTACVGRPVGIYGGVTTVDTMLAEGACLWGWQTSAWSNGIVSARAQLYQRQRPTLSLEGTYDEDVALAVDWGGWDGGTAAVLTNISAPAPALRPPPPPPVPAFPGTIALGSRGLAVVQFQSRLRQRGWNLAVDGVDGPMTTQIIREFQTQKGLVVDGIGGPLTWRALWTSPITPG